MSQTNNNTVVAVSTGFSECDGCERIFRDDRLWLHHASWLCAKCHPSIDAEELHLEDAREAECLPS